MKLELLISDFYHTPLRFYFPKIFSQFRDRWKKQRAFNLDKVNPSYSASVEHTWKPLFDSKGLVKLYFDQGNPDVVVKKYLNHEFDVLGSGWCDFSIMKKNDLDAEGIWLKDFVHPINLIESRRLWKVLQSINPDYIPLDWQTDVKSGYRFRSKEHSSKIKTIVEKDGVDVKVPWEFARMQHLPEMSLWAYSETDGSKYRMEVQCQILDFIMCNPPRWGVHWTSAMEVSIRLLNTVVAVNMLLQADPAIRNSSFYKIFTSSIQDHLMHAWEFREHKEGLGNNHYLANLTGVLYGAYVSSDLPYTRAILKEARIDMLKEINKQFLEDGGNVESSTTYHCFSSEIAVLALSLISKVNQENLLEMTKEVQALTDLAERKIFKALDLIEWMNVKNGQIPQIGDNDSARILYWNYPYTLKNLVPERDYLNYTSTIAMLQAYYGKEHQSLHGTFVDALAGSQGNRTYEEEKTSEIVYGRDEALAFANTITYGTLEGLGSDLTQHLQYKAFPHFGIYLYRSDNLFLLVNGTNRRVAQYWPHSHNDKLSFELWMGGQSIVRDPGSYSYTGFPELRNKYRSVRAHATAVFDGEEQNTWRKGMEGVFRMRPETKVEVLSFSGKGVRLKLIYRKYRHIREFIIEENRVVVHDSGNFPFEVIKFPDIVFSNGYGKLEA